MSSADTTSQTPSRDWLRIISLVLVVIGLLISGYLSYSKLTGTATICVEGGASNCEVVQSSVYSKLAGIPIAYMGLATYVVLGLMLLFENRVSFLQDYGVTLVFGITLFAFLFSVYLVYLQAFQLQAYCIWCLSHEITMTLLFIVSGLRVRKSMTVQ